MVTEMTYGERLALARIRAGLTQQELAVAVGMKQPSRAHLEKRGEGSAFTVKLARACGVSADWLDDEIGEMLPREHEQQSRDPRIEHVCQVMQSLPAYAVDVGVREIDSIAELISHIPQPDSTRPTRPTRTPLAKPPLHQGGTIRAKTVPADKKKLGGEQ